MNGTIMGWYGESFECKIRGDDISDPPLWACGRTNVLKIPLVEASNKDNRPVSLVQFKRVRLTQLLQRAVDRRDTTAMPATSS